MIVVKMIGGAKKSFPAGTMTLDCAGTTVARLLDILVESKPADTPALDTKNILVAVNGADSSSLDGRATILRDGDEVSIIPVIHGGSGAVRFEVQGASVMAICVRGGSANLDKLRLDFPAVRIQAVARPFVLGESHLRRILEISVESERREIMLSSRMETDILLRLAGTTQIAEAIRVAGAGPRHETVVIAVGDPSALQKLLAHLSPEARPFPAGDGGAFLMEHFGITGKHLGTGHALEDLLVESASVL